MEVLKALDEGREKIASQDAKLRTSPQFSHPTTESVQQSQILVNELIKDLLKFATTQWMQGPVGYAAYPSIPEATPPKKADITRVIGIVNHCIHYGLSSLCRDLFKDMTKAQQEPRPFILNYQPLVKPLCDFLRQKNVDIASTPFIKFFKTIIATYICLVLGREDQPHNVNLRRVGCASAACPDCKDLDTFMLDASRPRTPSAWFRSVAYTWRTELELLLTSAQSRRFVPECHTVRKSRSTQTLCRALPGKSGRETRKPFWPHLGRRMSCEGLWGIIFDRSKTHLQGLHPCLFRPLCKRCQPLKPDQVTWCLPIPLLQQEVPSARNETSEVTRFPLQLVQPDSSSIPYAACSYPFLSFPQFLTSSFNVILLSIATNI